MYLCRFSPFCLVYSFDDHLWRLYFGWLFWLSKLIIIMKKIYLDSIELNRDSIKSVLQILYNIIVFNRVELEDYKLCFDKYLERQYLLITDKEIGSRIKIEIEEAL